MMFSIMSHFCYGLAACFIGGLPLGMINMSVVNIALKKSARSAYQFAFGSSLVEIFEASVAVIFGLAIEGFLRDNQLLQFIIFFAFVLIGIYFLLKKPKRVFYESTSNKKYSEFIKGIAVALLNPQAVPFWIFALAFVAPYHIIDFVGANLYFFLGGVFIGKLLALVLFTKGAKYLKTHLSQSISVIDKTMGSIFIIIGIIQALGHYL
jgi:threonine/homoserine/homoserine lactone efflux protein